MRVCVRVLLLAQLLALVGCQVNEPTPAPPPPRPEPGPIIIPIRPRPPKPCPGPGPCPRNEDGSVKAVIGGRTSPDGQEEIQIDLPNRLHQKNRGGSDGSGLCVFASMRHSGLWADEPVMTGLFEWMFTRPGGGYPSKVDDMIDKFSKEKSVKKPSYIQVENGNLDILRLALEQGLLPGVTYVRSPTGRYRGDSISHMVSLPHLTANWAAVLDNNYPGDTAYEWMSPADLTKAMGTKPWFVIPLKDGPPPRPHNKQER